MSRYLIFIDAFLPEDTDEIKIKIQKIKFYKGKTLKGLEEKGREDGLWWYFCLHVHYKLVPTRWHSNIGLSNRNVVQLHISVEMFKFCCSFLICSVVLRATQGRRACLSHSIKMHVILKSIYHLIHWEKIERY